MIELQLLIFYLFDGDMICYYGSCIAKPIAFFLALLRLVCVDDFKKCCFFVL